PAIGQRRGKALKRQIGFACGAALAENDAVDPVIAENAAPKRVVEIKDETFAREATGGGDDARDEIAIERRGRGADRLLCLMPAHRIAPGRPPGPGRL